MAQGINDAPAVVQSARGCAACAGTSSWMTSRHLCGVTQKWEGETPTESWYELIGFQVMHIAKLSKCWTTFPASSNVAIQTMIAQLRT